MGLGPKGAAPCARRQPLVDDRSTFEFELTHHANVIHEKKTSIGAVERAPRCLNRL